jgi:hypothetical protein
VELTLGRLRLEIDDRDGSDRFGTGPLGDGMAIVRGLKAIDPVRSVAADRGSNMGVNLAEIAGLDALVLDALMRILVSMRLT